MRYPIPLRLRARRFAETALFLLCLAGCGKSAPGPGTPPPGAGDGPAERAGFPCTREDALGRTLTLNSAPERIVSLSPGATEILFAIGAGGQVAGVTEYCTYPPEAAAKPKVGGFAGNMVNLEYLAALKPGLVIVSQEMHQRIIDMLDRLGIRSFAVEPRNFEQVYGTIETLGVLTGNQAEAQTQIALMRAKIDRARQKRGGRERPRVFWELTDDPLMTTGGGTFINEAIDLGGGVNIFAELPERWPVVSAEQVLIRRPDWIIAGHDRSGIVEPGVLAARPGWGGMPAVQANRIATVNADAIYRYGPRLADAVLAVADILWEKE
jgi:iron complex transport system substrate-binding protein